MSAYASSAPTVAGAASRRTMLIFLGLFVSPGVAQSVLLTVVPLEALRPAGDRPSGDTALRCLDWLL